MGVTPLMLGSLDKFAKAWSHHWTSPVEWDPKKRILVYNNNSKNLVPWAVALFLLSFPLMFLIFLLSAAPLAGLNKLPVMDYTINLVWLGLYATFCIGETATLLLGKDAVHSINSLLFLHKSWTKGRQRKLHMKKSSDVNYKKLKYLQDALNPEPRMQTLWESS